MTRPPATLAQLRADLAELREDIALLSNAVAVLLHHAGSDERCLRVILRMVKHLHGRRRSH